VLSIDGSTGAITNVARTNVNNIFTAPQTITGLGASIVTTETSSANELGLFPEINSIYFYNDLSSAETYVTPSYVPGTTVTITLPGYNTTLAGLAGTQTFTGTNTFSSLANFSTGISSAGATFTSTVTVDGSNVLNAGNIQTTKAALEIDTARSASRVAIGDITQLSNGNYIYLRNATNELNLVSPYGEIKLGDSDSFSTGNYIYYYADEARLTSALGTDNITNFQNIFATNAFYETANQIRVTNNARSWFL
jgi:hypothetical protein